MRVEQGDKVLTLTLDAPPFNVMSFEYIDEIEELLPDVEGDESIRALVFTADGDEHFSVGMDLKQLTLEAGSRGGQEAVLDQRRRVLGMIENLGKPSVATLFGYCLGGGLELPLACTFRLAASDNAKIGLPEMDLGAVPAWGGTARLTRCVGVTHAMDMILRGLKIDGEHAYRIGLVSEIHPMADLKKRAQVLAAELAEGPRLAMAGMMKAVLVAAESSLDEGLDAEREAFRSVQGTPDQAEGGLAFLEKRKPVFE
jgi:enoyl-CoA hydratase/carnithine racemase